MRIDNYGIRKISKSIKYNNNIKLLDISANSFN